MIFTIINVLWAEFVVKYLGRDALCTVSGSLVAVVILYYRYMELKQQNKMKLLAVTSVLTISWLSVNGQGA